MPNYLRGRYSIYAGRCAPTPTPPDVLTGPLDGVFRILASGVSPCFNRYKASSAARPLTCPVLPPVDVERGERLRRGTCLVLVADQRCGQSSDQTSHQTCEAKPVISSSRARLSDSSSGCGSPWAWLCAASSRVCRPHALAARTRIQSCAAATAWTTHTRSSRPRTATWAYRRWRISFHCSRVAGSTRPAVPMGGPRPTAA